MLRVVGRAFLRSFAVLVAAGHCLAFLPRLAAAILAAIHHMPAMFLMALLLLLFVALLAMLGMSGVGVAGRGRLCSDRRCDNERQGAQNGLQHLLFSECLKLWR